MLKVRRPSRTKHVAPKRDVFACIIYSWKNKVLGLDRMVLSRQTVFVDKASLTSQFGRGGRKDDQRLCRFV